MIKVTLLCHILRVQPGRSLEHRIHTQRRGGGHLSSTTVITFNSHRVDGVHQLHLGGGLLSRPISTRTTVLGTALTALLAKPISTDRLRPLSASRASTQLRLTELLTALLTVTAAPLEAFRDPSNLLLGLLTPAREADPLTALQAFTGREAVIDLFTT